MDFLIELTREAANGAPVLPVRYPMPEIDEISLTAEGSVADPVPSAAELLGSLSFEFPEEADATDRQNG